MTEEMAKVIFLDKITKYAQIEISAERLLDDTRADILMEQAARILVARILVNTPGKKEDLIFEWPETWIDAFKMRWFPKWLLSRYPVVMVKHVVTRGCTYPTIRLGKVTHYPVAFMEDREVHKT